MYLPINNLPLRTKLVIAFASILMGSFLSFGLLYSFSRQLKIQAAQGELAARQAMLFHRVAALAAVVGRGPEKFSQQAKAHLQQALVEQEQGLQTLKEGGILAGREGSLLLPAASPEVAAKLKEMEAYLARQKKLLENLVAEPPYQPLGQLQADSSGAALALQGVNPWVEKAFTGLGQSLLEDRFLQLHEELTAIYRWQDRENKESFFIWMSILLGSTIGVLAIAFKALTRNLHPLAALSGQLQALADGHLPAPLEVTRGDEWGPMAAATNRLTDHLSSAAQFAQTIGEGNLSTTIALFEHKGQLAEALYKMRDNLSSIAQQENKRTWAAEGIAQISDILRSATDFTSLSDHLLFTLVKYLKASQGSLFVYYEHPDQPLLELVSSYAFERKKYSVKQLLPGEGLVGQAYLEKETIYLLEIPDKYLHITSGLGEANPKALLMVPLQVNGQVNGVIEMASFTPFEAHQIAFIEKIAESMAATITTMKMNEQTKHLLKESQLQAEQLGAQEEEMRQNMEELEATQEEMRRNEVAHLQEIGRLEQGYQAKTAHLQQKELEMKGFLAAVDSTLVMIEFDLQGNILSANDPFLKAMGYRLEEIVGKHHRMFVKSTYSQSEEYARFWQQLQAGIAQVGEVKRVTRQGEEIYLSASYTPVFNEEKRVVKIIKFAQDITGQKYAALDYQSQLEAISKSNAVIEFDLQGHILSANDNFLQVMHYELSEIKGAHHRLFVQEHEKQSGEYDSFWNKLRRGEYITGEFERLAKGDKKVWIKGSYNPIKDLAGKVYKVVKYAQDVTAQKQLELKAIAQIEELQAQEEEIRQNMEELQSTQEEVERMSLERQAQIAAIDSSLATVEFDLEGRILKANENFLAIMGYGLEEVVQQPHRLFVEADYGKSKDYERFWKELKGGKAQIGKVKRLTKSGQPLWLNASYTPVFDLNGQPVKIIKLAQVIEVKV